MSVITYNSYFENRNDFQNPYSFQIDDFQMNALDIIRNHEFYNIFVMAPTGAGKTLVAEMIIEHNFKINKRTIITGPVKALLNQKYYDFRRKFPHISFGLITGDYKCNPFANCIIMTTEILLNTINNSINILKKISNIEIDLSDVASVVFDEAHMINNSDRGKVWEQCIIKLNPNINQILLSATLDGAERLAICISTHNKHNTYILNHTERPVPLHFFAYYTMTESNMKKLINKHPIDNKLINNLVPLMTSKKKIFFNSEYNKLVALNQIIEKEKLNGISQITILKNTILFLDNYKMTPALFFILSKNKIVEYIQHCSAVCLTSSEEQALIRNRFNYYLHKSNISYDIYEASEVVQTMISYAVKGYAYHHSGLLPIIKEIIELLYADGLIKILFATETFSVGLNMPTKTVVFTSLSKFDGNIRYLEASEFIQMAGRAGRRGLDTIGHVIILPQYDISNKNQMITGNLLNRIMTGKLQSLTSKYIIDPIYVLRCLYTEINPIDELKNSLLYLQIQDDCKELTNNIIRLNKLLESNHDKYCVHDKELKKYDNLVNQEFKYKNHDKLLNDIKKNIPNFDNEYSNWKQSELYLNELNNYSEQLNDNQIYLNNLVDCCYEFLFKNGFIDEDYKITLLGNFAIALGDDVNPLLLAKMLFDINITNLPSGIELTALMALFCSDKKESDMISVNPILSTTFDYVNHINQIMIDSMTSYEIEYDNNWIINQSCIDITYDWLNGKELAELVNNYNIYEGDFIKNILKLNKLIEKIKMTCIEFGFISISDSLKDINAILIRGIMNQESIYITLN